MLTDAEGLEYDGEWYTHENPAWAGFRFRRQKVFCVFCNPKRYLGYRILNKSIGGTRANLHKDHVRYGFRVTFRGNKVICHDGGHDFETWRS